VLPGSAGSGSILAAADWQNYFASTPAFVTLEQCEFSSGSPA
jgi:hypothetical protein